MRPILFIPQGLPAFYKSSWVKANGLQHLTVCRDSLRRAMYGARWSQEIALAVDLAEAGLLRLAIDESGIAIADGCHTDLGRVRELIIQATTGTRTRVILVQFQSNNIAVDAVLSISRQRDRPEADRVPDEAILNMACQLASWPVDHCIPTMAPEQAARTIVRELARRPVSMTETSPLGGKTTTEGAGIKVIQKPNLSRITGVNP